MYHTLLGEAGFRKGMDLYFKRHDGNAVTCDDFRAAMSDANDKSFDQFELWYTQKGTPLVTYDFTYDESTGSFALTLEQSTPTDASNLPFHIPVRFGVVDKSSGEVLPSQVLELTESKQSFSFSLPPNLSSPVPSLLRDFSAPVKLVRADGKDETSIFETLAQFDTDGFNRWEAGQKLATKLIFEVMQIGMMGVDAAGDGDGDAAEEELFASLFGAFSNSLTSAEIVDESIRAFSLMLPSESSLAEEVDGDVDPILIKEARGYVKRKLADKFSRQLFEKYYAMTAEAEEDKEFTVDSKSVGRRKVR